MSTGKEFYFVVFLLTHTVFIIIHMWELLFPCLNTCIETRHCVSNTCTICPQSSALDLMHSLTEQNIFPKVGAKDTCTCCQHN